MSGSRRVSPSKIKQPLSAALAIALLSVSGNALADNGPLVGPVVGPVRGPVVAGPLRPSEPPVMRPMPGGRILRPVKIDPSKIEMVRKGPAIQFKAIPMVDPSTGKPVTAEMIITLKNGKRVQAGQYYAQLNQFEKGLNDLGYSLRNQEPVPVVIQKVKINKEELNRQANVARANHVFAKRIPRIPVEQNRVIHTDRIKGLPVLISKIPTIQKQPDPFIYDLNYQLAQGDDQFAVSLLADFNVNLDPTAAKASALGSAGGTVFGQKVEVIHADANLNGPISGDISLDGEVLVLGQKVWHKSWGIGDADANHAVKKEGEIPLAAFDVHGSGNIVIVCVPVSFGAGVKGDLKVEYDYSLLPLAANASIGPSLDLSGYVQVGIGESDIAEVGAAAELTFIADKMPLVGDAHLGLDHADNKLFYSARIHADDDIHALDGRMYVFAKVWVVDAEFDIFKWDGFKANGSIFDLPLMNKKIQ